MLPNHQSAFIDDSKLVDYCLSESHDIGKHKAVVFKSLLGIAAADYLKLKSAILKGIAANECLPGFYSPHGKLYVVDFEMINFDRNAIVRTSWIIKNEEDFARLTSCYVKT